MKKGRVRFENRGLLILLGVLCVVIVGLGVGVIIVNSLNNDNATEIETKSDEDIINDILNTIEPMSIEDTLVYLDELIATYDGTVLEIPIKMIKFNALANADQFEEVIAYSGYIDINELSDSDKLNFYSVLQNVYSEIGDEENANFYDEKFVSLYYEIFGMGEEI